MTTPGQGSRCEHLAAGAVLGDDRAKCGSGCRAAGFGPAPRSGAGLVLGVAGFVPIAGTRRRPHARSARLTVTAPTSPIARRCSAASRVRVVVPGPPGVHVLPVPGMRPGLVRVEQHVEVASVQQKQGAVDGRRLWQRGVPGPLLSLSFLKTTYGRHYTSQHCDNADTVKPPPSTRRGDPQPRPPGALSSQNHTAR